jgi:tungstate transport system substrate-binding protein
MKFARSLFTAVSVLVLPFAVSCGDNGSDQPGDGAAPTASTSPQPTKASGTLILATTTSTQDSGLLDVLVPMFEDETGYNVKAVAVGSGQAIEQASRGDADVVLVHSPAAEEKMVADGNGIERALVMHNDFIIVGPQSNPAGLAPGATLNETMTLLAKGDAGFISRGDNSGTHALELKLWKAAAIDPKGQGWYAESGQGMGATLQIANQKSAYTISDRGTYLSQSKNLDLVISFEGAKELLNVYHVIIVNPGKHANVNAAAARAFAAFITRADIQRVIADFGVAEFGEPLFIPDAGKPESAG